MIHSTSVVSFTAQPLGHQMLTAQERGGEKNGEGFGHVANQWIRGWFILREGGVEICWAEEGSIESEGVF